MKFENLSCAFSLSRRLYLSVPIPLLLLNIKEKTRASVLDAKARTCSVSSHGERLLYANNLRFGMQCSFVKKLFYFRKKKKQKSLFWAVQWSVSESFQAIQFVCWGVCCHSSVVCVLGFVCVCICVCVCVWKPYFQPQIPDFLKGWYLSLPEDLLSWSKILENTSHTAKEKRNFQIML